MAWNTYKIATTGITLGQGAPATSIAIIDGQPAIAYLDYVYTEGGPVHNDLRYARYNPNISSWVDSKIISGRVAKLCEIKLAERTNGTPIVFYYRPDPYEDFVVVRSSSAVWSYESQSIIDRSNATDTDTYGIGYKKNNDTFIAYIGGAYSGGGVVIPSDMTRFAKSNNDSNSFYYTSFGSNLSSIKNRVTMLSVEPIDTVFWAFTDSVRGNLFAIGGSAEIQSNVASGLTNCHIIHADGGALIGDNYPFIYYTNGNIAYFKKSLNYQGTSWGSGSSVFYFSSAGTTTPVAACEVGSDLAMVYRDSGNAGINYYKGFQVRIVNTSDSVGNFSMATDGDNIFVSYYKYNSTSGYYEIWIATKDPLVTESYLSESSSSVAEKEYLYSYFQNGDGGNLLNIDGNFRGDSFILPVDVNICALWGYSGDDMYNLKLEDVDNHRILCHLESDAAESTFNVVPAGTHLRVVVNDGSPGNIMNSYEVRFRFSGEGESSEVTESFSSYSTASSQSSSTQTVSTSSMSSSTQTISTSSMSSSSSSSESSSSTSTQTNSTSSSISSESSSSQSSSSVSSSSESSSSSVSSSSVSSSSESSSTEVMTSSMSSSSGSSSSESSSSPSSSSEV